MLKKKHKLSDCQYSDVINVLLNTFRFKKNKLKTNLVSNVMRVRNFKFPICKCNTKQFFIGLLDKGRQNDEVAD